jgi:ABC-type lipoprotein export system ATPase subunit/predicted acetyltransferase
MSAKLTVTNETPYQETFRSEKVRSQFDIQEKEKLQHTISLDWNLPNDWQIGAIVGPSGSGKTTLIDKQFTQADIFDGTKPVIEWPKNESIVDGFPNGVEVQEITKALSKVGFSSPPNWLQPYHTLSTGQRFRVDMARLLIESTENISIVDEFTSTVDRKVAKSISHAVSKYAQSQSQQFIAVSCHYDILEWLEPDWVVDLETEEVSTDPPFRKPEIEIEIRPVNTKAWEIFREHHYLDHSLNEAAHCYVGYWDNKPVTFIGVLHFPHPDTPKFKRVTRFVTLPAYQGLGIGTNILNKIAHHYRQKRNRFVITTSHPALMYKLNKISSWRCISSLSRNNKHEGKDMNDTSSSNRKTATFEYDNKV